MTGRAGRAYLVQPKIAAPRQQPDWILPSGAIKAVSNAWLTMSSALAKLRQRERG